MYDFLIVGAGLFGSIFAHEANKAGKRVLVIDKRSHIAGNIYTENMDGIQVHKYGAHIFHTNNKEVWDYVNQFAGFNRYTNSPVAVYKDELYNLPFNMNTFSRMWGVKTPEEAKNKIDEQVKEAGIKEPQNLEEQAIYTGKQWGRPCRELPSFIIKRLPVRFTYDNNYFNDRYQGIPTGGYTQIIERMLEGVEVKLNTDFFEQKEELMKQAEKVVFTGMIDEYFDYCYGELEYRSLRFETEKLDVDNYQGNAVVNYTEYDVPYTRIIEHKHFEFLCQGEKNGSVQGTVITREYPSDWQKGDEPYYPMNDNRNNKLYAKYKKLAEQEADVIFGGRLGMYKYFDMHNVVEEALNTVDKCLN